VTPRDIYGNIRTGMNDPVSASIDVNAGSATLAPEVAAYVRAAGAVVGLSAAEDYKLAFRSLVAGALVVSVSVGSGAAAVGPASRVTISPISIWKMTISILSHPVSLGHIPYQYPG